jgi:hypothetical protein
MMKLGVGCMIALLSESTNAFTASINAVAVAEAAADCRPSTLLFASEPEIEESGSGLDLDLEDMFTMFNAADKNESFEDAIKKVKADEQEAS